MPVHAAEHQRLGVAHADAAREPAEGVGGGAAVRARRHVGIAERDHRHSALGEGAQQHDGRLARLLQIVDDDEAQRRDALASAAGADRLGRERRELGRIEAGARLGRHPVDDVAELVEHARRGRPFAAVGVDGEPADGGGVEAVLGRPHPELAELGAEGAQPEDLRAELLGPPRARALDQVPLDQLGEQRVLLATGEQRRPLDPALLRGRGHGLERQGRRGPRQRALVGTSRRSASTSRSAVAAVRLAASTTIDSGA
ncbi:hypothetical protein Q0F99_14635 [Rathayibacter oskolensis]|uniref:hypothetical protein n=1 Tax=Rathayibacter oskolensis TaxID=1891671 RepID=UPI00265E2249|nr:hypothetical protein [Rathayibacter oskolensis]WKK70945.1 hypothetical protein Q0F99_14635 [Rathayibacter oskolensis]